jgi:GAF domain-containing protein
MFAARTIEASDKPAFYDELCSQLSGLLHGESDAIANAANTSALIFQMLPGLNWVGFYFLKGAGELVLGPFQGKPTCVRIAVGRGVCGAAVARKEPLVVEDDYAPCSRARDRPVARSRAVYCLPVFAAGRQQELSPG